MTNSVAVENARTGTARTTWDLPAGQFGGCPDLQGFADGFSVDRTQPVHLKIGQNGTQPWTAAVYRLGWYGGRGARHIANLHPTATQLKISRRQPTPADCDPGRDLISADCAGWKSTLSWIVPPDVPSGVFLVRLNRADGAASHILFVVRDDARHPDIRVQLSDPTWQAYNAWGGLGGQTYRGNSLYHGTDVDQYNEDCARVVSYNRPIINRGAVDRSYGAVRWSTFFTGEYPMIRWLERCGYDVAYMSGIDGMGGRGPDAKVAMMIGHNEYWSQPMRDAWTAHLAAGGHMFVSASNEVFWRTIGERPDSICRPRLMRCHKDIIAGRTPPASGGRTGTWRAAGMPENDFTGTIFAVNGPYLHPLTVSADYAAHSIWRRTAVASQPPGELWESPPEILGFEIDTFGPAGMVSGNRAAVQFMANPGPAVRYASSTMLDVPNGALLVDAGQAYGGPGVVEHRLVALRRPDGGLTFATGSVNWALGLDDANVANGVGNDNTSTAIRQATVNALTDMNVFPSSQPGGVVVTPGWPW